MKNRLHLDVRPYADDDQAAEVARLLDLGAVRTDVGQSPDVTWTVLSDPEATSSACCGPRTEETLLSLSIGWHRGRVTTQLETARLVLRQWKDTDRDAYFAMNSDPEVRRFFPSTQTRAETDAR